jgi:hypothetical protein
MWVMARETCMYDPDGHLDQNGHTLGQPVGQPACVEDPTRQWLLEDTECWSADPQ